jgi:hypothetical protein
VLILKRGIIHCTISLLIMTQEFLLHAKFICLDHYAFIGQFTGASYEKSFFSLLDETYM